MISHKTFQFFAFLIAGSIFSAMPATGQSLSGFDFKADTTDSVVFPKFSKDLPLGPDRIIEFSTNTGTWMSVDVHPSGQKLIFDMLGDLYEIPVSGGTASRLTQGMAFDTHPRYSPDGKFVLFTSDRDGGENVFYMNLEDTSEVVQVTKSEDMNYPAAAWTPDGTYIVASRGRRIPQLWLYHKDGGRGEQLIDSPQTLKTIDPAVSPDGRYIYYSQRTGAWNYNAQLPQYQIGQYDRETGKTRTITSRYGSAFTPVLSSDGKWLVYGSRYEDQTGLVLRNLANGNEKWLIYPVQRDEQESVAPMGVLPAMAFSPDNSALFVSFNGGIYRVSIPDGKAENIPVEIDVKLEMGPRLEFEYPISDKEEAIATQIRDGVPSPDGKWLAFTVLNKLYIKELPDGSPRRITEDTHIEAQPSWSPDGKTIVYVTWDENTGGHIYSVKPFERRVRTTKLTIDPAIYSQPVYAPGKDRIVAIRGSKNSYNQSFGPFAFGANENLIWIPATGGAATLIDLTSGRSNPHFTDNAERIFLNRGNGTLLSIRWDGTDEKEHVRVTGITTYGTNIEDIKDAHEPWELKQRILHPEWFQDPKENNPPSSASIVKMAPKGDQALALVNNDIYVVTVPVTGGKTPTVSVANTASSQFPSKKLTEIGGQFPAWSSDAKKIHWSIGNAHFIYNLDDSKVFEDSLKAAKKLEAEQKKAEKPENEDEKKTTEKKKEKEPAYQPEEITIEVKYKRDIPKGIVLLKNATIITMRGDEVLVGADILVENNRIKQVGKNLTAPAGAEMMNLAGKTIVPGFVDTHAHMWPAWNIHKQRVWNYAANLAYGVTTSRDPQTSSTDVLTYSDMVDAGMMEGPRVYSTGPGLGFWMYNIKSLEEAKRVMQQYSKYYNTKTIKMYLAGNRKQRQWILMAAKEQKIMPTTEGALDWKLNMTQLIDGYPGHEHSLPIYPIYKDAVQAIAQSQMAVTPTLLVSYGGPWGENYYYSRENPFRDEKLRRFMPYEELASKSRRRPGWFLDDEHVFYKHAEFMNDLVKAGGLAGVGSHGQLEGLGYHWELWSVQSGGMSNHDALKVATILGAKAIGLAGDLGSIEAGKLADLVILDKNPLDNIRNTNTILMVMKNGRIYDGNTLDHLYPEKKKAGPFEWKTENPVEMIKD